MAVLCFSNPGYRSKKKMLTDSHFGLILCKFMQIRQDIKVKWLNIAFILFIDPETMGIGTKMIVLRMSNPEIGDRMYKIVLEWQPYMT